jgi:hypothetical protein
MSGREKAVRRVISDSSGAWHGRHWEIRWQPLPLSHSLKARPTRAKSTLAVRSCSANPLSHSEDCCLWSFAQDARIFRY